ncbi:MAG: hypothetical protein AB1742_07690 [bacterium]
MKQTEAESFLTAFHGLPKSQRKAVIAHLVRDKEFGADLEDIVLIERARQEKGKDIPLDGYVRSRMKDGR